MRIDSEMRNDEKATKNSDSRHRKPDFINVFYSERFMQTHDMIYIIIMFI